MCFVYKDDDRRYPRDRSLRIPSSVHFDYDSDGRYCQGACSQDDYCRCAVYENLHLTSTPAAKVTLAAMLEWEPEDVSEEFMIYGVNAMELHEFSTYWIHGEPGYYGEEAVVEYEDESWLEEWITWWLLHH